MKVLAANVGSTSLKFKLFEMPEETALCEAKIERVGSRDKAIFAYGSLVTGKHYRLEGQCIPDYTTGIRMFLEALVSGEYGVIKSVGEIDRIGFKTVLSKGFYGVHELTDAVMDGMRDYLFIAPVHNAAYLEAIGQFNNLLPDVPKIGVFETAFHTTIPIERRIYGVPYEWYEKYGLMRMGYHGASHGYIAQESCAYGKAGRVISCHLGGSCSVCAIQDGRSVDTSFGFSLQSGLIHANRTGDADPYMIPFLQSEGLSAEEIEDGLSKHGGLLGISGVSNDMRDLQSAAESGNERARLAVDAFVSGIIKQIGAFYAELGGLDQLVFTGGIGEHSAFVRNAVCSQLRHLGIELDEEKNSASESVGVVSAAGSAVLVTVVPANEELGVARETAAYEL
ncbi:MAG: acetate/propionate family kinase [Candidatus Limivicinus sp.]|nr:acetate/propionate family kinase [Candidatus Limivicinus sp.]